MVLSVLVLIAGQVPVVRRPPVLATAAGITVGLTTLEGFEHRHGKGLVPPEASMGNARVWYDAKQKVVIRAASIYSSKDGQVVEGFEVTWLLPRSVDADIPRDRLQHGELGVLAKLRRFMSPGDVERALHVKLDDGKVDRSGLIRYSRPLRRSTNVTRYEKWEINFAFDPLKGLGSFEIISI